jgi:hypothetical protein
MREMLPKFSDDDDDDDDDDEICVPKKPCSLRLRVLGPPMVNTRPASTGLMCSSMSFPYKQRPACVFTCDRMIFLENNFTMYSN